MTPHKSSYKIYLLLIVTVLIWGLSWPVNKIGLQYMPPLWFATFRLFLGTLTLFILVGALRKLKIPHRNDFPLILIIGILQIGLFMLFLNLGLKEVPSGRSAILTYTTPLWVMPIAIFFFHEKGSFLKWLGFCLGMGGVIVLFSPWSVDWTNHRMLWGSAVLLLAAICMSIPILCARNMRWHSSPLELLPWQLLLGTTILFVLAYFIDPHPFIEWNKTLFLSVGYTAIFSTAFGYLGAITLSKELPSITASLGFLGIPVAGLVFSALLLHEPITTTLIISGVLILSGLVSVALAKTA